MEKSLLKISGLIAIIIGIFYSITIIMAIIGIPLIIGGSNMMGYANLSNSELSEKKNSILGWSVFFFFFTVVGGILGLVFYLTMDNNIFTSKKSDYIDEIKKLDELRKQGIISDKEYEAKKKKILDI